MITFWANRSIRVRQFRNGLPDYFIIPFANEKREGGRSAMLKIAVCDDEQSYLHDLTRLLDEYGAAQGIGLAATAFSLPFDLLERVESGAEFDLYLLDVYMPGMTGIELASQLRRIGIETPVVFLTTSKEHALEAFGVGQLGIWSSHSRVKLFSRRWIL